MKWQWVRAQGNILRGDWRLDYFRSTPNCACWSKNGKRDIKIYHNNDMDTQAFSLAIDEVFVDKLFDTFEEAIKQISLN